VPLVPYSNEFLKFLEGQQKNTDLACWFCRPCTMYAQGMNHCLKEMEKRLDRVEESSKKNEYDIKQVKKGVEKIEERLESRMNYNEDVIFEEIREREAQCSGLPM
jgi:hypothetical protein